VTVLAKLAAVGSVTVAAASVTYVAVVSSRQTLTSGERQGAAQAKPAAIGSGGLVCAGTDSILRLAQSTACPEGQTPLPVSATTTAPPPEFNGPSSNDWPPANPNSHTLENLEQRINTLRNSPLFTVVDARGTKIFTVKPDWIELFNAAGYSAAYMAADGDGGGFFGGRSADWVYVTNVGATQSVAGVQATQGGILRLALGRFNNANYALRVLSMSGGTDLIAGLGESRAGTGAVIVGTAAGRPKVSMSVEGGRGEVKVFNNDGTAVVSMRQALFGSGLLVVGDASGEEAVKMGVVESGYGAVLAGPQIGFPLVPSSGLPGSYFLGCKGGEKCHPW
jgi:hypothetical protein